MSSEDNTSEDNTSEDNASEDNTSEDNTVPRRNTSLAALLREKKEGFLPPSTGKILEGSK